MTEFPRRQIGHTGLQVTELGLGCATLGGSQIAVARAAAEEIVGAAWTAGVRYVDTAPYYGVGQAERCVGDALRDRPRGEWVLSTKVGRLLRRNPTGVFADGRRHPLPFEAVYDYSYDGIMRSFEDSGTDRPPVVVHTYAELGAGESGSWFGIAPNEAKALATALAISPPIGMIAPSPAPLTPERVAR